MLCKRHGTAVEPAVNHFRYAMHRFSAFRTADRHFIDIRAVKFDIIRTVIRHRFQFLNTSDRMHMSALTFPDIERCSPVTVTADSPILHVFQPVAETAFSDTFRNPVDRIVIGDQIVFHFCHLDKPGFARIIDQRCVTSPAVRITMFELRSIKQLSS